MNNVGSDDNLRRLSTHRDWLDRILGADLEVSRQEANGSATNNTLAVKVKEV